MGSKLTAAAAEPPMPSFAAPRWFALEVQPDSSAAGDFNHDGNPDLAVAGRNGVSLLLGQGDHGFQTEIEVDPGRWVSEVIADDFDQDGRLDLALAAWEALAGSDGGALVVLRGKGDGHFFPPRTFPMAGRTSAMIAGDFDEDEITDVAVAGDLSETVTVFRGKGDGTFIKGSVLSVPGGPTELGVADFNGDGHLDLASVGAIPGVALLLGNGDGTFLPVSVRQGAWQGQNFASLVTGDFNHDSHADLILSQRSVQVWHGNGDSSFRLPIDYSLRVDAGSLTLSDVNRDGNFDLLLIGSVWGPSEEGAVLLGRSDGTFGEPSYYWLGSRPTTLAVGDFTKDGRLDLAATNLGIVAPSSPPDRSVTVLSGTGDGSFPSLQVNTPTTYLTGLAAADFNGDGSSDLVAVSPWSVSFLWNHGDGTFLPQNSFAGEGELVPVAADLNGDQTIDLALASTSADRSSWLKSWLLKADGTFLARGGGGPIGHAPWDLGAADLDRDGDTDLAVLSKDSTNLFVFLGQGDGYFGPPASYEVAPAPSSFALADLDGDGFLDAAVSSPGAVAILLGNGDGSLGSRTLVPVEGQLASLAVGDLNGDHTLDLAVGSATTSSWTIRVLLGHGDGTFQTPTAWPVGGNSTAVLVEDCNQDGHADVISSHPDLGAVSILAGRGDGTFAPAIYYFVGANEFRSSVLPKHMASADLNRDGRMDFAVGRHMEFGTVAILVNTFAAPPLQLEIGLTTEDIRLSWPVAPAAQVLESAASFAPNEWQTVWATPSTNGSHAELVLPMEHQVRFFRLRSP